MSRSSVEPCFSRELTGLLLLSRRVELAQEIGEESQEISAELADLSAVEE